MSNLNCIAGVGIDIVDISGIRDLLTAAPEIVSQLFTAEEIKSCEANKDIIRALATKYAAKEAIVKSLGKRAHSIPRKYIEILDNGEQAKIIIDRYWESKLFPGRRLAVEVSINSCSDFVIAQAVIYFKRVLHLRLKKNLLPQPASLKRFNVKKAK